MTPFRNLISAIRKDYSENSRYLTALEFFWSGNCDRALDLIDQLIAVEGIEDATLRDAYRLWLECLKEKKDQLSLVEFARHVEKQDATGHLFATPAYGLRALAHAYAGNETATDLYRKILESNSELREAAAAEFLTRFCPEQKQHPYTRLGSIDADYFLLASAVHQAFISEKSQDLSALLTMTQRFFPASPLDHLIAFHRSIDLDDASDAVRHSSWLAASAPQRIDYAFFKLFSLWSNHQYRDAHVFYESLSVNLKSDSDIAELGSRLAEKMQNETNTKFEEKDTPLRHWIHVLTPSEALEFRKKTRDDLAFIARSVHKHTQVGDLVYLMTSAALRHGTEQQEYDGDRWLLLGIFDCKSQPRSDIYHPAIATLGLIELPGDRVEVDVSFENASKTSAFFEMDDLGLEKLTEAVRRRTMGVDHVTERRRMTVFQKVGA